MKPCSNCKTIKPLEEFNRWTHSKDGRWHACKVCHREYKKAYRKSNIEATAAQDAKWRSNNPEAKAECDRRWRAGNKDKIALYNHTRRAKEIAGGKFSLDEWVDLCAKFDNKCLDCKQRIKLTPDHVLPLSKGGTNTIENIQPLCLSCNHKKGAKHIDFRIKEIA